MKIVSSKLISSIWAKISVSHFRLRKNGIFQEKPVDKRDSFFGGGPNSTALSTRSSTAQFPANGFVLDAVAYYDTAFLALNSNSASDVQTSITAIFVLVQNFYNLKDSLGTTVQINVKETRAYSGALTASGANIQ